MSHRQQAFIFLWCMPGCRRRGTQLRSNLLILLPFLAGRMDVDVCFGPPLSLNLNALQMKQAAQHSWSVVDTMKSILAEDVERIGSEAESLRWTRTRETSTQQK